MNLTKRWITSAPQDDDRPEYLNSFARQVSTPSVADWGWLPALSMFAAVGLFLIVLAFNRARVGSEWSALIHWGGILVLFVPICVRLYSAQPTRTERIGLIAVLGLGLYLAGVLSSPTEFKFTDELQHWRSAQVLLQSNRLFQDNPILPISPLYPGLESVTTALASLSGLSIFHSGVLVMAVTRLVFVLALYLLYERVSNSSQVAGVAALLYMTNPHFLFLAGDFIYQSLALPLAVLALLLIARARHTQDNNRFGTWFVVVLTLASVVVTHHVTSYALVVYLALWTLGTLSWDAALYSVKSMLSFWRIKSKSITEEDRQMPVRWITLLTIALIVGWVAFVAPATLGYLSQPISNAANQMMRLLTGSANASATFQAPSGPLFEQIVRIAAVGLVILGLPLGIWRIWRKHRANAFAIAAAIGSLGYFASLGVRFTSDGAALTVRAWTFIFVLAAFVLAIGVVEFDGLRRYRRFIRIAFPMASIILFMGGVATGWPPYWGRLPGPYMASAFERSVDLQNVSAAKWTVQALGKNNRFASDYVSTHILGAYGEQDPSRDLPDVFFSTQWGLPEQAVLQGQWTRYLFVDQRLCKLPPMMGIYFNVQERAATGYAIPIAPAALAKFDDLENVSRIFDSGDITIYDAGVLLHAP